MRRLSGTKAMPARRAAAVDAKIARGAVQQEAARLSRILAEQGAGQLDLAAAHEAVDAGDLARRAA